MGGVGFRATLGHAVLRGIAAAVTLLPWRALGVLGAVLGWFCGRILRIRRRHVVASMQRAGLSGPNDAADGMYRGLATGLFELFWLAGAGTSRGDAALDTVVFEPASLRLLHEARARGPVVLAASHTGNWELVAYAAARELRLHGSFLAAVVKPLSVRAIHAFCMHLRARAGLRLLAPEGALKGARAVLAEGGVVVMPVDQVPAARAHGAVVSFLGAPAWADVAPAAFAKRTGATLLVVGAVRAGKSHQVRVLDAFSPSRPDPDFVPRTTAGVATSLEAFVRAHPASWMWLHRRWRAPLGDVPGGDISAEGVSGGDVSWNGVSGTRDAAVDGASGGSRRHSRAASTVPADVAPADA